MAHLLPELNTRSVLDVVEENFHKIGLKTYAIRMIYIGEHSAPREAMMTQICKTVHAINGTYCDVPLSGLLIVYDGYFVHIVEVRNTLEYFNDTGKERYLEGSEDTVHRLLRFLFTTEVNWIAEMDRKDEEEAEVLRVAAAEAAAEGIPFTMPDLPTEKPDRKMFKRLRLLMVYHSIQKMLFKRWHALPARPPSLVGRLDVFAPLPQHVEQLKVCLDKISKLCILATTDSDLSFEGMGAADPKMDALPEVALLDFLMQSQHILDLREVMHMHRRVDDHAFYFERVWPLPNHFTPRLLYKLKVDDSFVEPLPVMPWEMVKKETNEDEDGEPRSGSDSSD